MGNTNKYWWHAWGVLTVYGPHWVCQSPRWHVLSGSILLRLHGILQEHSPKWTLHFMTFPLLSRSDFRYSVRAQTQMDCAYCALPRSKKLRLLGSQQAHCSRRAVHLNYLPSRSCLVSWECCESTISLVPCVSSGKLISGCDTPGRCQQSRILGRRG